MQGISRTPHQHAEKLVLLLYTLAIGVVWKLYILHVVFVNHQQEKMVTGELAESSHEQGQASSTTINVDNMVEEHVEDVSSDHEGNDDDNDDDMTVIILEHGIDNNHAPAGWSDPDSPEMEERRRSVLLRELQRVQRASFIHFMILCLIPTSLLFIVIATVLGEEDDCESAATTCMKEARTFINAFTTRCVCEAITVVQGLNP